MRKHTLSMNGMTRRDLLRAGLCGLGIGAMGTFRAPSIFGRAAEALAAQAAHNGRILVVLELSGRNDGLNTMVPYGDDAYYRHRPTIGVPAAEVRKIDNHFGFNPGMVGFERLLLPFHVDGLLANGSPEQRLGIRMGRTRGGLHRAGRPAQLSGQY